jgi:hypothetical protein
VPAAEIIVPLTSLELALNGDLLPLPEILGADLRESLPHHDRVVLGRVVAVADVLGRGHRERRDVLNTTNGPRSPGRRLVARKRDRRGRRGASGRGRA